MKVFIALFALFAYAQASGLLLNGGYGGLGAPLGLHSGAILAGPIVTKTIAPIVTKTITPVVSKTIIPGVDNGDLPDGAPIVIKNIGLAKSVAVSGGYGAATLGAPLLAGGPLLAGRGLGLHGGLGGLGLHGGLGGLGLHGGLGGLGLHGGLAGLGHGGLAGLGRGGLLGAHAW